VRETGIGVVLGIMLGVLGFLRAVFAGTEHAVRMGATVAVSVIAVVTTGTLVGSLLPLAIKRVGLDPAVSSTPFIASLVDVLGLLVYFSISRVVFAQLLHAAP
ncbi:MAG TPA: magnesium transporter, partial [Polyangiales bacterium]|nr:magnesium transporter [Polyangiales bacterium]